MSDLATIAELFRYSDNANELLISATGALSAEQLDRPLDLGMGSVRRICLHLLAGEKTWLQRIQGNVEAKWMQGDASMMPVDMLRELEPIRVGHEMLLARLDAQQLDRVQQYRDSKGSLFQATLHEMLLQNFIHSTHHRAQIVNGLRRVGGTPPEVDYMHSVRKPVG